MVTIPRPRPYLSIESNTASTYILQMSQVNALIPTGTPGKMVHGGMYSYPQHVLGAYCEDGQRRKVMVTGQPSTMFSIPGRITYKGKTVSGEICSTDMREDGKIDFVFYARGKYSDLLTKEGK